ncbi:MAG: fused MFS/spermidine synthase [Planctomycetota bacterium]|nr:fused MFS/spermidine synthase [Planctomycetota bacterium]
MLELSSRRRSLALVLFLFSGFSGLVYQVVWARQFALVLGTTTYAIASVLAVFMGGLALGSWIFGRIADRRPVSGLRLYGWLEIVIGGWALALPFLIRLCDDVYRAAWPSVEGSFAAQLGLRIGLVFLVLLVPTTCMGGTLPVLSLYLVRSLKRSGATIGSLYAVNTVGAVAGCLVTGFFLIEWLGLSATLMLAAFINLAVGVLALTKGRGDVPVVVEEEEVGDAGDSGAPVSPTQMRLALIVFAISGFAALSLEVLWTRSLMFWVHIDTWAFTAMLSAFLTGIALGSFVMARLLSRVRRPLLALGLLEALIGVSAAATVPLLGALSGAFEAGTDTDTFGTGLTSHIMQKLGQCFFVMLAPTVLMGAAFPLVSHIYVQAHRKVGEGTGTLYALNTVGAIVGSLAAGFILIPVVGIQQSILLVAAVYGVLGVVVLWHATSTRRRPFAAGVSLLVPVTCVLCAVMWDAPDLVTRGPWAAREDIGEFEIRYYNEGPDATLAVVEKQANAVRLLTINGVTTAIDNYMDMQVHRMLSHLPLLIHEDPKTVLVVGFGMGSTAWGCLQHPVDRVDVVELLRAEKKAAPFFEHVNHGVIDQPRLNFIVADGRNYILASRKKYDVISFNAIHPRFSSNLYTKDFYELCSQRLNPGGIVCAWMTQNALTGAEWDMLCRSMTEVYPHVSLWYCNPEHYCLLASDRPMRVDWETFVERMERPGVLADLAESHLDDARALVTRFLMGDGVLKRHLGDGPVNTDDKPLIEFGREVEADERGVVLRILEARRPVDEVLVAGTISDEDASSLTGYAVAAGEMMLGQTEFWYPRRPYEDRLRFRRALALAPDSEDLRFNVKASSTALANARRVLRESPQNDYALRDLARILLERGDLEAAHEAVLSANGLRAGSGDGVYLQGLLELLLGDPHKSVTTLEPFIRANWDVSAAPPLLFSQALHAYATARERVGRPRPEMRQRANEVVPCSRELFDLMCSSALGDRR